MRLLIEADGPRSLFSADGRVAPLRGGLPHLLPPLPSHVRPRHHLLSHGARQGCRPAIRGDQGIKVEVNRAKLWKYIFLLMLHTCIYMYTIPGFFNWPIGHVLYIGSFSGTLCCCGLTLNAGLGLLLDEPTTTIVGLWSYDLSSFTTDQINCFYGLLGKSYSYFRNRSEWNPGDLSHSPIRRAKLIHFIYTNIPLLECWVPQIPRSVGHHTI